MRLLIICDQMPTLFRGDRMLQYAVNGVQYFHTRACLDDYDLVVSARNMDNIDLYKIGEVTDIHILLTGREVFLFRLSFDLTEIEQMGKEITGKLY